PQVHTRVAVSARIVCGLFQSPARCAQCVERELHAPSLPAAAPTDYPRTMTPEERLRQLGHDLPPAPKSIANYVGSVQTGNLLFLSGKGPDLAGGRTWQGKLGADFTTE